MSNNELAALVASGRASLEDMAALGAEQVAQIKTHPELLQVRAKAQDPISVNEESRTISYLVSDETVDRMGDIIKVKGWDISQYKRNPVVLWAHDGKSVPPIGKANNVRRRYGPARLTADIEFAPKEAFEFADTIYQLASRGYIRATSVGFMPTESEEVDEKKREKLGLGPYGQLYTGAELMEISVVAVPANPSALEDGVKTLAAEGLLDVGKVARFFDTFPASDEIALARVRAACRSFVDFGATVAKQAADSLAEDDPVEKAVPEALALDNEGVEKSPACRMDEETEDECASRKIPELIDEGMEEDQAVAAAHSMCETACGDEYKGDLRLVEAVASLIEQQAEQTRATRQLVDSLTDLTKTLHGEARGGAKGGSVDEPDAGAPDADEPDREQIDTAVNGAVRGFAERIRRELFNTNPTRD
jgi:phage head maturation protease